MMNKRPFLKVMGTAVLLASPLSALRAQTKPIVVGSTLSLTGPLAGTALMHKISGEIFIEQLNKRGGLLGRKVEWLLKDDQSKPDLARTLYEQLITGDKVDLLMGPYATANTLSAMGVAQRNNKVLVSNSFGIPSLAKYDMHFPGYVMGTDPGTTVPNTLVDAILAGGATPKSVAVVTSKFPSVVFLSTGAREVFKKRGLREALWLEWEFGNKEFGPIASRLKEANADFLWIGTIGPESLQLLEAMHKIDYRPKIHFHVYPTPGPLAQSPLAANALTLTTFEQHAPFTNNPAYAEVIKTYNERAAKANLPDTVFELQAANAYTGWQILEAGVKGANSLDDRKIADWLKANRADTIIGRIRFDGPNNYGDDFNRIKQLQSGKWVVIHPKDMALPGAKMAL
jgi:ABC-type branched-subunit amino acid transport system substrate-binding protein